MKKIALSLLVLLVIAGGLLSFVHPTAFMSYVSFKGKKQGQFKGENSKSGREKDGWFNIVSYDMGGETPVDAAQPAAKGKRQHNPISIVRESDAATPLLLQALTANEVFESVTIQTFDGNKKITKTMILSDAVLKDVRKYNGSDGQHTPSETISFTYSKITWANN